MYLSFYVSVWVYIGIYAGECEWKRNKIQISINAYTCVFIFCFFLLFSFVSTSLLVPRLLCVLYDDRQTVFSFSTEHKIKTRWKHKKIRCWRPNYIRLCVYVYLHCSNVFCLLSFFPPLIHFILFSYYFFRFNSKHSRVCIGSGYVVWIFIGKRGSMYAIHQFHSNRFAVLSFSGYLDSLLFLLVASNVFRWMIAAQLLCKIANFVRLHDRRWKNMRCTMFFCFIVSVFSLILRTGSEEIRATIACLKNIHKSGYHTIEQHEMHFGEPKMKK